MQTRILLFLSPLLLKRRLFMYLQSMLPRALHLCGHSKLNPIFLQESARKTGATLMMYSVTELQRQAWEGPLLPDHPSKASPFSGHTNYQKWI